MKKLLLLIFIFALAQEACKTHKSSSNNYGVAQLSHDDSTFLALKDTAQAHLQIFIDELDKHGKDTAVYRFGVKSDFVENGTHEHMWSRIYDHNNRVFQGNFIDSAFQLKKIKLGDVVSINKEGIEDWSVYNVVSGKTIGSYSSEYLRSKMKEDSLKK